MPLSAGMNYVDKFSFCFKMQQYHNVSVRTIIAWPLAYIPSMVCNNGPRLTAQVICINHAVAYYNVSNNIFSRWE